MSATAESIDVRITGDASGATGAMTRVGEAVSGAVTAMQQKLIDLGIASKESFGVVGETSLKAAAHVEESSTIIGLATEKMKMHMESVATKYEAVTGLMGKLNGVMMGALALLAGGEAFDKAIEKTNELAAENLKLSKTFGMTLAEASGFHAALAKFGIDTETVTGAVQKMDRQVRAHESTMNDMGVKTRDASGALLSQLDIFMGGIDALRQYKEGIDRNLAAQAMFGRGVGDVAALLKLNRKELEEGAESARKLGLVTDQAGVESMKRYKVAINETKEVFEAIMVAIGKKVLPAITELAEYIKDNGAVVMERLGTALDILGAAFTTVGAVIGAAAAIVMALYDNALAPLLQIVEDLASRLRDRLATSTAFLSGHMDELRSVASTLAGVMVTGLAAAMGYYATVMLARAIPATITFARTLFTQVIPGLYAATTALITGIIPALGVLAEQLALNIFRMIALDAVNPAVWIGAAVGAVAALAAGFAYWLGWLDPIIAKMKTLWDWTSKFLGLDKAFKAITGAGDIPKPPPAAAATAPGTRSAAGLIKGAPGKEKADKAGKADTTEQDQLDALQKELAKEVKANSATMDKMIEDRLAAANKAIRVEEIKQKGIEAAQLDEVAKDRATADNKVALGTMTAQQRLDIERTFLAREYAIKADAIAREIALEKSGPDDPLRLQTMYNQQEALLRQHNAKMLANDRQFALQRSAIFNTAANSVTSSWGAALAKMATLQASFSETIKSLWQGVTSMITNALASVIEQYLVKWLTSLLIGKGAQATTGASEVVSNAAVAGSAAYASTAAIPIVGPELAPAAGMAAYGGAMSFLGMLPSFATGAWDLPGDMIAQVHKGEMIVPRTFADDFRSNGGPTSSSSGSSGGGDTYHIQATDADSFIRMLHGNRAAVAKAVKAAVRDGVR